MKIIEKVLKTKLASFGFDVEKISNQLSQMDFDLIDSQIGLENEADNFIQIRKFTKPTVEISRLLVNINNYYIQNLIVEGNVNFSTLNTSIGTTFPIADYKLSERICIVATTVSLNIEVVIYEPAEEIKVKYSNKTYEELVADDRKKTVEEYYEAFVENGRVTEGKVKNILALLLSEYIFDEMIIDEENPKIKMYDNPDAYAENITEYRLKYINRKTNRVELAHHETYIRRLGVGVTPGLVSNDPYIKLDNLPECADFSLNNISCYWVSNDRKNEVAIYIATKSYDDAKSYKEYKENNSQKYTEIVNRLKLQFATETGTSINADYIQSVLKKLNPELIVPSMAIIRDCMSNPSDPIEPLKYRFKAISNPSEFEERLYISIEDNIGKRYKYKLTENVLEDLTRIGNKLEYTNDDGKIVKKQSIADFNKNANCAIIRRETLIDSSKIPGLLGYIYEDVEYIGTDMLPVPSIEVDFYFPNFPRQDIAMFNGTNLATDLGSFAAANRFNNEEQQNEKNAPGTTFAIVKYVNSKGEILKENTISNLFPGTAYTPEILPIINDLEGKEWVCAVTQHPTTIINISPEYNVIEIKYKEKYANVTITYLSRDGKKIRDDVIETIQAGSTYDITSKMQYLDEQKNDWKLVTSRPQKLVVKDDSSKNNLILVYDIDKENVTVKYIDPKGELIIDSKVEEFQIGKYYNATAEKIIFDKDGLGYIYNGVNPKKHLVEENKDNTIVFEYEEYKLPVIVSCQTVDGIKIINDVVEYIQVGKKYTPKYNKELDDIKLRAWKYKEGGNNEIVVSKNEKENIIIIKYEPVLANVFIQMLNESGGKILNPIQKSCQIGEEFASVYMNEVTDNFGKVWIKKEDPASLVVSRNEMENNISIKYKPLIVPITVNFFDDERNEIIPSKTYEKQAGTLFKPDIIENLESDDGRKWSFEQSKVEEITVKRNPEENIVSIFYNKQLTDITIEFEDAYKKKLKDSITIKGQIGAIFNPKPYDKIEDFEGYKWMMESSDPQKLVIKNTGTKFKFIYGELKAIVIVKYINVKTNKSIINDVIAKVKLGGAYIPNIPEKVYDNDKLLWKFIGDTNISIIVKENEQENIILLQYDEALAKVRVKYQDTYKNILRDDIVYEMQVGQKLDLKNMEEFIDGTGIGWVLNDTKTEYSKVQEDNNEILNIYDPWKVDVKVKYINPDNKEIASEKSDKIQIGRTYAITYNDRITDDSGLLWSYKEGADSKKIAEKDNVFSVMYQPVYSNVIQRFINKTGEIIKEEHKDKKQVGSLIEFKPEEVIADSESKKWSFVKIDRSSINVKENEEQNIVNAFYVPKLSSVIVKLFDDSNNAIIDPKTFEAQIGAKFVAELPQTYINSKTKLGYKLPEKYNGSIIVQDDKEKNIINIKYDKYLVKVTDRIVDEKGNAVFEDTIKELQVGTTYTPSISKEYKSEDGREWYYGVKREKGIALDDYKKEDLSITVNENPEKNIVIIKLKPVFAKVTIKYQNTLGLIIAPSEEAMVQVGLNYEPEIKDIIKDSNNNKWTFNPNSKSNVIVSRDERQNIIELSYEEEKAPIIYKYEDELKNRLKPPRRDLAQIGSVYTPEFEKVIEDEQGRVWEYKSSSIDKLEIKESEQENVIEIIYVPLLVDVEVNIVNKMDNIIMKRKEKAQLGGVYTPSIDETIFDDESLMYKYVKCTPKEKVIKEEAIGALQKENTFNLTYEPVYSNVTIKYQDIDGNKLRDDDVEQLQVGTKFTPNLVQYVSDKNGIQWENIATKADTIRIMENSKDNIVKMTFEIANAEVLIRYRDVDGNTIKEAKAFQRTIGSEFIPEIEEVIADNENKKWSFVSSNPVKLIVGSINNIINMVYQEKKVPVKIKYETIDGKKLRADVNVQVQEGTQFVPKKNFAIIYDENEIWRYLEFRPSSLLVTDNEAENVIIQVYDNQNENVNEKPKLENPFANTNEIINEEEIIKNDNVENSKVIIEEEKEKVEQQSQNEVIFIEPNLINLSKSVLLTNEEKASIIKLNQMNINIIKILNGLKNDFSFDKKDAILHELSECMTQEKELIKNDFSDMLSEDKTGKKFLKILEAIVSNDGDYQRMQERKVILLTDYFINTSVSNMEQANYICERGKNVKELLILEAKINEGRKNNEELKKLFVELLYERAMLDNYYKTRTKAKDEYFDNNDARSTLGSEIVIIVTNMLPKQAFSLLQKSSLNELQQNELDAIINLLSQQQKIALEKLINDVNDGKLRKEMLKKYKNIK